MTVAHHELVWNRLPDMRSTEQVAADDEIDHLSRDEPDRIERLRQDIAALTMEHDDQVASRNNLPKRGCPACEARVNARRDLVAEASLKVITGRLRQNKRERRAHLRIVAQERQLVLAVVA